MRSMATRQPLSEIKANQACRRNKIEADILWNKITKQYQQDLAVNNSLRRRLRYVLDKTRHKLLVEPASF